MSNTFSGYQAGYSNTTGFDNTFSGVDAGHSNTTGSANTFSGVNAGYSNTGGCCNAFYGLLAGYANTTGIENTFSGEDAGFFNTTGDLNTFLGFAAGYNNTAGNSDIYIGNQGPSPGLESNTIRIGTPGNSTGQQNTTYIAGIAGSTVTGVAVNVNTSTGQLGVASSSRRFKEQIHDMGESSSALMKLRPVTFLYKPEYDKGPRTLQYGLIAEEVADIYPDLVAYEPDGKPYTVKYQYLTTMLLNEVQKQYHRAEAEAVVITQQADKLDTQQEQIKSLQRQNQEFQQRLSRLEGLIGRQEKVAAIDTGHGLQ